MNASLEANEVPQPNPQWTVLRVIGRVDATTSSVLEHALAKAAAPVVVLDMGGVSYVSSSGLRVLLSARRQARERSGDVVLCQLTPPVRDVLTMVGFSALFTIKDSAREYLPPA